MINKPTLTPSYDNKIYQKYSKKTLQNKTENKLAFQEEFGFIVEKRVPLLCITIELSKDTGGELFEEIIDGILKLDVQIVVLAVGTERYQKLVTELADKHGTKIRIIPENDENKRKIYAASDIALVFNDKEGDEEIINYLSYGIVPVCLSREIQGIKLENYNPVQERGNGFLYKKKDKWLFFRALVRALENFLFPFDWKTIQINCMETTT